MAGRGLGAGAFVGADCLPVLCAGCQVELSAGGLRAGSAGAAAVCAAALPELVSASSAEAGKLEGTGVQLLKRKRNASSTEQSVAMEVYGRHPSDRDVLWMGHS